MGNHQMRLQRVHCATTTIYTARAFELIVEFTTLLAYPTIANRDLVVVMIHFSNIRWEENGIVASLFDFFFVLILIILFLVYSKGVY